MGNQKTKKRRKEYRYYPSNGSYVSRPNSGLIRHGTSINPKSIPKRIREKARKNPGKWI